MSDHTPGPWVATNVFGDCWYVWSHRKHERMVADAGAEDLETEAGEVLPVVARMRGVGRAIPAREMEANARLIARAPEMAEEIGRLKAERDAAAALREEAIVTLFALPLKRLLAEIDAASDNGVRQSDAYREARQLLDQWSEALSS